MLLTVPRDTAPQDYPPYRDQVKRRHFLPFPECRQFTRTCRIGLPKEVSLACPYSAQPFFRAVLMRRRACSLSILRLGSRIWTATSLRGKNASGIAIASSGVPDSFKWRARDPLMRWIAWRGPMSPHSAPGKHIDNASRRRGHPCHRAVLTWIPQSAESAGHDQRPIALDGDPGA
jgi:hypothetical protein